MSWQAIRNGLIVVGLTLGVSWGIATFTYGSAPATDIELAGREPDQRRQTIPSPSPTTTIADPGEPDEGGDDPAAGDLITAGVTVQVLNGSGDAGAGDDMARRLRRLGFDVVITDSASEAPVTTVFWSSRASRPAGRALAREFEWEARVKPPTVFASADIHVLVGTDL